MQQVVDLGDAHGGERFAPDRHGSFAALLDERHLPVVVADGEYVPIVAEVEVDLARALLLLSSLSSLSA